MLFKFLKYLQPTHYFSLEKNNGKSIFPVVEELPQNILEQLTEDHRYNSKMAIHYDLSWQAIHKGYIGNIKTYKEIEELPLEDNYRFSRKYFNSTWVLFVLLIRVFSFKNPFKECHAWFKTRSIKRSDYLKKPIIYNDWTSFESRLLKVNYKVSVIIPTLNRYKYLETVLNDFDQQDYKNFEIVIVDQSDEFNAEFYNQFKIDIKLIQQKEKALWLARNTAIKNASGTLIAFSEDDVRLQADWISNHIKCLDFFTAQISAGVFYPEGQHIPFERSYFRLASQFATGNAMLYKDIFKEVGLFDRQFEKQRMGDGEFGLRCYMNGIKSVSNPFASCIDVKAPVGGLRQFGSWDAFRTANLLAPRPLPSVLYFFRRYFGNTQARWALLRTVPMSIMPYRFKANKGLQLVGVFISILILPLVLFQVFTSWRLSSKKLQQGPLIERYYG